MVKLTNPGDEGFEELAKRVHRHNVAAALGTYQTVVLQYTKLANYWGTELPEEWGGDYLMHKDIHRIQVGLLNFMECVTAKPFFGKFRFIWKLDSNAAWSPDNLTMARKPNPDLGLPFEPYLGIGGSLLPISHAAKLLCIDAASLVMVKLRLIIDEKVVEEGIRRMLRPRPQWDSAELGLGGKGRHLRIT